MTPARPMILAAVEGPAGEAVLRSVVAYVGAELSPVYGKKGKADLRFRVRSHNHAAQVSPWIVLVDLNHDHAADCAPHLLRDWLPQGA